MHIFQNGSLVIHDVAPEDSGSYTCIAGNSCNIRHTEAPLFVVGMARRGRPTQEMVEVFLLFHAVLYVQRRHANWGDWGCPFQCHRTLDSWLGCHLLDIPQMRCVWIG